MASEESRHITKLPAPGGNQASMPGANDRPGSADADFHGQPGKSAKIEKGENIAADLNWL